MDDNNEHLSEWIFTFGYNNPHRGHYVRVRAHDATEARVKMIDKYGIRWALQYTSKEWSDLESNPNRTWELETQIDYIK